jgi:hypothetical protein
MKNADIDAMMMKSDYGANLLKEPYWREDPEDGMVRVYESKSQRFLVEVRPGKGVVIFTYHETK